MSYLSRKWMVSLQDDGVLKAMNGWYYICDSDGGIMLGYFKDKEVADEVVTILNSKGTRLDETYPCAKCDHELTCGRIC